MKLKLFPTGSLLLIISMFGFNCGTNQTFDNLVMDLPNEFQPQIIKQNPDFYQKDNISEALFKEKSDIDSIVRFYSCNPDSGCDIVEIKLLKINTSELLFVILEGRLDAIENALVTKEKHKYKQSFNLKIIKKQGNKYLDLTKQYISDEYKKIAEKRHSLMAYLDNKSIVFYNQQHKIELAYGMQKFEFVNKIPDELSNTNKKDNKMPDEFLDFWAEYKQAILNNDTVFISKNTLFPFSSIIDAILIEGETTKNKITSAKELLNLFFTSVINTFENDQEEINKKLIIGELENFNIPEKAEIYSISTPDAGAVNEFVITKINNKFLFVGHTFKIFGE